MNIIKPKWREVREVTDLGPIIDDDSYMGIGGVIFEAEKSHCFAYLAEINGKVQYVIPIERDEFAFDTVDEASRCSQLMEFAVREGMFPSFAASIAEALHVSVEQLAVEVMLDRESGDIAPEQDQIEKQAVKEIAEIIAAVWAQNRARA